MNKVILMGRLTRDPEIRYTQGENSLAIASFTLAVERKFKKQGEAEADFISCKAFGKIAEHAEKYYKQGIKIAIVGKIQTGSYTSKEGHKIYTTEVVVEETEFAESKSINDNGGTQTSKKYTEDTNSDGFMNVSNGYDEDLPFN